MVSIRNAELKSNNEKLFILREIPMRPNMRLSDFLGISERNGINAALVITK
jgi:hypothetical protein